MTRDRGALACDDRIDALAMAVAYWTERMGQDEEAKMRLSADQLLDMELALWTGGMGMSLDMLAMGVSPAEAMKIGANGSSKGAVWTKV